jgi:acetyl-CoA C-acetyltransferase
MTINKVCGSGLKAVMLGSDAIQLGHSDAVVAGGQENMTLAPHLLMQSRQGYRMGHQKIIDSMILDGLWDPYNDYHMGNAAELCVEKYKFSREEQDAFAIVSYQRAQRAQDNGYFRNEICSVTVEERGGPRIIAQDEEPTRVNFEKISTLRPAFDSKGTITAANASKINDGAAAILLASKNRMEKMGSKPLAKIVSQATWAQAPSWFTTAPIGAIQEALRKAQLSVDDIDLWEINEAFANVAMAAIKELSLPHEKVNIHGGAIALGHPIGGSGARILTTLVHSLHTHNKRYGLATLCIGGGEAVAIIIERT